MGIRNYTTGIKPETTIAEIRRLLTGHGVREVSERFDDAGRPVALSFAVETRFGERRYVLPVNVEGTFKALERDWERRRMDRSYVNREQARRTAWRNVKDWISLQLALVESGGAAIEEVMLPYMQVEPGATVWDAALAADLRVELPPARRVIALPAPREREG